MKGAKISDQDKEWIIELRQQGLGAPEIQKQLLAIGGVTIAVNTIRNIWNGKQYVRKARAVPNNCDHRGNYCDCVNPGNRHGYEGYLREAGLKSRQPSLVGGGD